MFRRHVLPALSPTDTPLAPTEVRAVGLTEVQAADLLGDLLDRTRRPRLGIRVGGRVVRIAIDTVGEDVDVAAINSLAGEVYERLHPFVLPQDADNLFTAVGDALCKRKWTLATAESCTGGGIGSAVTSVIGSSVWYAGGWVTYANSMKMEQLAVPSWLFGQDKPGAVSSETVQAMAAGARERAGSDIAIAVSGVAGPDGGTLAKPVGTSGLVLLSPKVFMRVAFLYPAIGIGSVLGRLMLRCNGYAGLLRAMMRRCCGSGQNDSRRAYWARLKSR